MEWREKKSEDGRFTPNWVTDNWWLPSGDSRPDWKQSDFERKPNNCTGCKLPFDDAYVCIECPKRDFGLHWLPEQYYGWNDQEKEEWKLRMKGGVNGNIGTERNLSNNQSTAKEKK